MKAFLCKVKTGGIFLLLLVLANAAPLSAQPTFSGYVKFFAYPNLNAPFLLDRYGSRLQLAVTHQTGSRANFYAAFNFDLEENRATGLADEPRSAITEIYPVEVYVDLHWEKVDLRLGKQFVFWGRTDWVNPTDNITPWDFQNITAEIEDYRLSVGAAKLDAYLGEWTVEAVVVPFFKPNRIAIEFPDTLGGIPVLQPPPRLPDSRLKNWQFGLRADSYAAGFDFSFSYWQGFDLFPSVHVGIVPGPGLFPAALVFQQRFHRIRVAGMDFARSINRLTVKGEAAYFATEDRSGTDVFIKNPHLQVVLGLDYTLSDRLSANVQYVQETLFKYSRRDEIERRRRMGDPDPDVDRENTYSASARIQYKAADYWDFQLIGVVNFADWDAFLLPILRYDFADGINIYLGAALFTGPADSPFGRNRKFSRAFFDVKYSF